jgi:hypothetical protein
MSELTLGIDVSDHIARLAIVTSDDVVAQSIVSANRAGAIKDAAKKAIAAAKGKVGAVSVALPAANMAVPDDHGLAALARGRP